MVTILNRLDGGKGTKSKTLFHILRDASSAWSADLFGPLFKKKMKIHKFLHKLSITDIKNNKQSVPYLEVNVYVIHISSK